LTRQLLLNEIQRIYVENKEKKEDISDEIYAFKKYPHLVSLFEQNRIGSEKWEQLVRELLFYTRDDLRYMYDRTMQLIRRYQTNTSMYFKLKTEGGTYTLPDRLSDLNRLFELYMEFFTTIYPNVNRKLSFDVYQREQDTGILQGRLLWSKTIKRCVRQGGQTYPTAFTVLTPECEFETPENIIVVLSILRLRQDSLFLLDYDFSDKLSKEEQIVLNKIADGCEHVLRTTLLGDIIPVAARYVALRMDDPQGLALETQSRTRLQGEHETNPHMLLLQWVKKYRELNLRSISINRTNFPVDRVENLDTMFEIWILLEFLDCLRTTEGAIVRAITFPKIFEVSVSGVHFRLYYEKTYGGWAAKALPDFSIEKDGELKVVMDAKNWLQSKVDAIYKMLGYLNNLDATIGILFFPNATALGEHRIHRGSDLKNHKNQVLFNCVAPPSGSKEHVLEKQNTLREAARLVLQTIQ
jgi:hypothetical protein